MIDASICIWTFVLVRTVNRRLKSQHKIPDPELPTIIESSTSNTLPANTSRVWERSLRPSLFSTHDPTQAMSQENSTQATEMAVRATGLRKDPSPPFPDSVSPCPGSCVFPPLALHLPFILSYYILDGGKVAPSPHRLTPEINHLSTICHRALCFNFLVVYPDHEYVQSPYIPSRRCTGLQMSSAVLDTYHLALSTVSGMCLLHCKVMC